MTTATATAAPAAATRAENEIAQQMDSWLEAFRAKNLDAIMAHYAPTIRSFDAIAELQFRGAETYRKHWEACLAMCGGEGFIEIHEVEIETQGDLAFSHHLAHCGGPDENGEMKSGWMRITLCWRKMGGRWLVVHEHCSSPFDMASGKVLFDAKP